MDTCEAEQDLDIELGPITVQVDKDAIKKLKNGIAPGKDNVHAEMLKVGQETSQLLQHILQDVRDNEVISDARKRGTITKLPRNGNLSECNNVRSITLLSINSKVFCRIIVQRITTSVGKLPRQEQAVFRNGKSCIDHIFVLRHIIEQSHEWSISLNEAFADFVKAFDRLNRPSILKILRYHGIPQKLMNIIKALYENI